ncbi:MAG: hypothetical protein KGH94_04390 [Candidatus Micrarchaeota archaeon]|nr:hypothetical protein [Candidatus Micrarchaeota archaeon]
MDKTASKPKSYGKILRDGTLALAAAGTLAATTTSCVVVPPRFAVTPPTIVIPEPIVEIRTPTIIVREGFIWVPDRHRQGWGHWEHRRRR